MERMEFEPMKRPRPTAERESWVTYADSLERRVEAASSYIDRIPVTWQMDIDLARELLHERGLTEEYEQRRLDYLRQLGYAEGVDPNRPATGESEASDG